MSQSSNPPPPSSKSPLQFKSTPNPPPILNEAATWTTEGGDGSAITWTVEPPVGWTGDPSKLAVTVSGNGSTATVTAKNQGMAVIAATQTQGKTTTTLRRYVSVGEVFGYSAPGNLNGAPSNEWRIPGEAPESGFPSFTQMKGYGMAYSRNRVVLNFDELNQQRAGDTGTCYFQTETSSSGPTTSGLQAGFRTFAYAPDGTLWQLPSGWGGVSSVPPGFPTLADMESRNAALSWAPPEPLASAAAPAAAEASGGSTYLTCYVLAVELFPAHATAGNVTTYYTVAKQPSPSEVWTRFFVLTSL